MSRRHVILLAALFAAGVTAAGGWWWHTRLPPRVNASEFENEMTAGLLRGLIHELATKDAPPVCFVAFGEGRTPATPGFMAQFADSRPALRSVQSSVSPPIGKHFEVNNGRPGLILRLVHIQQITPTSFDVVVSFSDQPKGRDRFIYRVTQIAGEWSITSRKPG